MATRRSVLAGAMAFCGCCLGGARAQTAPPRLPVTIGGKRVRTIDTHTHCIFHDAIALLGSAGQARLPNTKGVAEHFLQAPGAVEQRLKSMDDMAIDMEVLSINPFWYDQPRDVAAKIVEINNTGLAQIVAEHPNRFMAFGSLSLQYPDLAVQQLDTLVRKQGLKGVNVGASVLGEAFSDPRFAPVWAKAEEVGAVIFIHPQSTPELGKRFAGNGWLSNLVGNPLETTLALQHLIFEGTLDKHPALKILAAHGGGYLPSYAARNDHACFVSPQNCDPGMMLKKQPSEYLKQMYYDSLVFTPEALRHLVAEVGASQIMLGTDFPIPWELHPVDAVLATTSLSPDETAAILGGNAAKLLGVAA